MEQFKLDKIIKLDEQGQSEQAPGEIDLDDELSEDELENVNGGKAIRITNLRGNANQFGVTSPPIITQ